VRTVNKFAAIATQPQPAMIREIQERMLSVSNLVIGPISESILESNLSLHLVQTCNSIADLSLTPADVVSVKRLGRAGSQSRQVRVEFANSNARNKVFNEKRKCGKHTEG
jgi:hypothetical protein